MLLPPEIGPPLAEFNKNFPPCVAIVIQALDDLNSRGIGFRLRHNDALRLLKSGDQETGNDILATEIGNLAMFLNSWCVRYSHATGQMFDQLRRIIELLHCHDKILSGGLWFALKLDDKMILVHDNMLITIRSFRDALMDIKFHDEMEQQSLNRAVISFDKLIQDIIYSVDYLNRLRSDAFAD